MATQEDFTPEEWTLITELPGRVLGAVAIVDGKNPIKLVKEMAAGGSTLTEEMAKYPGNAMVQTFTSGTSMSAPADVKSVEDAVNALMDGVAGAFTTLRAKATPAEVAEVGEVLVATANAVANAAGSGMFGGGADKVDPREQAVLDRLAAIVAGTA